VSLMHSLMNRAREPRRIREDPVAFLLNVGLFYQGTVMKEKGRDTTYEPRN
jgi:hypothetical protein